MISILSPAKTLDMTPVSTLLETDIRFPKETIKLVRELKKYKPIMLSELMKISDKLALLNTDRYQSFSKEYNNKNSKIAGLAFKGGVYIGLEADTFDKEDFAFAQANIRILSGLYGLLRPLDLIQAYRLEMGAKLVIGKNKNLYQFWGDKITKKLAIDIKESGEKILINLASIEYFKAINTKILDAKIINIVFKEYRDGKLKFISFNAKKARGMMTNYIVKNRITKAEDLHGFDYEGYYYDNNLSSENEWLFLK